MTFTHMARRTAASNSARAGLTLVLVLLVLMLLGPLGNEAGGRGDLENSLSGPSRSHPMGADQLGRDVLARVSEGLRGSLMVGVTAAAISGIAGGILGLASGFWRGWPDLLLQRLIDALMAVPLLVLALAVIAATGPDSDGRRYCLVCSIHTYHREIGQIVGAYSQGIGIRGGVVGFRRFHVAYRVQTSGAQRVRAVGRGGVDPGRGGRSRRSLTQFPGRRTGRQRLTWVTARRRGADLCVRSAVADHLAGHRFGRRVHSGHTDRRRPRPIGIPHFYAGNQNRRNGLLKSVQLVLRIRRGPRTPLRNRFGWRALNKDDRQDGKNNGSGEAHDEPGPLHAGKVRDAGPLLAPPCQLVALEPEVQGECQSDEKFDLNWNLRNDADEPNQADPHLVEQAPDRAHEKSPPVESP